jgi:predicted nucleotide-binding protein
MSSDKVFVVHGRNDQARHELFLFLRALQLNPMEWEEAVRLTGEPSPYIGDVLSKAFDQAQAVVVLFTPDDTACLKPEFRKVEDDPECDQMGQARPNVLFEAGMAMGRHPDRTVLVEFGKLRPFTDIGGRHVVRLDSSPESRAALVDRLKTAGCLVDIEGKTDWLTAGDLTPPATPEGPRPLFYQKMTKAEYDALEKPTPNTTYYLTEN